MSKTVVKFDLATGSQGISSRSRVVYDKTSYGGAKDEQNKAAGTAATKLLFSL
jgi:hypothetical protein